jgi:biotin operon repressor
MNGEKRREQLVQILSKSESPVAGRVLSESLKVSRQVIVQDIALLRANGMQIFSTSRGYYLQSTESLSRVFKVRHTEEEVQEELNLTAKISRPLWLNQALFTEDVEHINYHELCIYFLMDITDTDLLERGDKFS